MKNLRRAARRHQAGVDPEHYWEFTPGQRVLTREGLLGTVVGIEDGPHAGSEQYVVELDGDMGGGEYAPGELRAVEQPTAAKAAALDHDQTATAAEDLNQVEAAELHTADRDYPELGQILHERPPLPHSERVASKTAYQETGEVVHKDGRPYTVVLAPGQAGALIVEDESGKRLMLLQSELDEYVAKTSSVDLGMPSTREAGVLDWWADKALKAQEESGYGTYNAETGAMASYDWCRFRHNRRCFFPAALDKAATEQAGYAVWQPIDRGYCPREKWKDQKECPAPSEPGPKSGERNWRYETWRSWQSGGQGRWGSLNAEGRVDLSVQDMTEKRPPEGDDGGGSASPAEHMVQDLVQVIEERDKKKDTTKENPYSGGNPYTLGSKDPEFSFHVTATWRDVQAKAKRIRQSGKVRVISASPGYLVGEVQGDENIYQTVLTREPGTQRIAMWECGCAWASYSWGRSGRWKKFEGRLCSHALALNYEGQSRGWGGGKITEDREVPEWRADTNVVVPGDYQKPPIRDWRIGSRKVAALPGETPMEEVAEWMMAEVAREEPRVTADLQRIAAEHHGEMHGLDFRLKTYPSLLRKLVDRRATATDPFAVAYDALRYTIALPEPDWANSVQETLWDLQAKGYTIVSEKNTWQPGDPYSGLHYVIQPPGSMTVFELQFHTSASYNLKEFVLHKMYEEFRNSATPLDRRQHLYDEMAKHWDQVPIPDNATDFPESSFLLRPVAVSRDLAEPPVHAMVRDMLSDGDEPNEVLATLVSLGVADAPGLLTQAMAAQPFEVSVRGRVAPVLNLNDDGTVEVAGVGAVPAEQCMYPTFHPTRGLTLFGAKKTAASDGCMVALEPPREMAEAIHAQMREAFGDGIEPVTNYHVTLAYPGDADEVDKVALESAVRDWASRWGPMTGRLSGYGVFHQEGGEKVLYASVDIPGLDRARDDLVTTLARFGIALPDDHGFTPHCTLLYTGGDETPTPPEEMPQEAQEEFTVSEVALVFGGDWRHVSLESGWREDIGTGRDLAWGDLPWGGDDLEWAPVHGVAEARQMVAEAGLGSQMTAESFTEEELRTLGEEALETYGEDAWTPGSMVSTEAELRDEPEPALPETTAEEEDEDLDNAPEPASPRLAWLMKGSSTPASQQGDKDMNIADAAKAHLAKTALKSFTPAEQKQIIEEGSTEGVVAANLDRLDITGTHYVALEEALQAAESEPDDTDWLL